MKSEKMRQNKFINIDRYLYTYIIISYIFWPIFLLMGFYLFNFNSSEIYFFREGLDVSSFILLYVLAPATTLILFAFEALFVFGILWAGALYLFTLFNVISATIISWVLSSLIFYGIKNWLLKPFVSEYHKAKIYSISGKVSNLIKLLEERYRYKTFVFMVALLPFFIYLPHKQILKNEGIQTLYFISFFLMGIVPVRFERSLISQLKWCFYWNLFWSFIYIMCLHIFGQQQWAGFKLKPQESIVVIQSSFLCLMISFVYVYTAWNLLELDSKSNMKIIFYLFQKYVGLSSSCLALLIIFLSGGIYKRNLPDLFKWLQFISGWIHSHYTKLILIVILGGSLIVNIVRYYRKNVNGPNR